MFYNLLKARLLQFFAGKYHAHHIQGPSMPGQCRDWGFDLYFKRKNKNRFWQDIVSGQIRYVERKSEFQNVLLCAQPKSASLYLHYTLCKALGFVKHEIGFDLKGGQLYYPRVLATKYLRKNTISHCHASPTPANLKIVKNLNIKVLVLYRNLADILVSRKDMLVKDGYCSEMINPKAMQCFLNSDESGKLDIIIDLFAGQYLNFYTGWRDFERQNPDKVLFISYEEMKKNTCALVQRVASWCRLERSALEITRALELVNKPINFNKGIIGRGAESLSSIQKKRITQMATYFALEDQNYLGISGVLPEK